MDKTKIDRLKFFLDFLESIEVTPTLKNFKDEIDTDMLDIDERAELFLVEFNRNFPINSYERMQALTSLRNNLYDIINLYLLHQKTPLIVELHSNLETMSIFYLTKIIIEETDEKEEIIRSNLKRKSLPYFTNEWLKRGVWDEQDVSFAKHLTSLRNSIAHKNLEQVQAILGINEFRGQMLSKYFIKENILPHIISTIKLEIKLSRTQIKFDFLWEEVIQNAKKLKWI